MLAYDVETLDMPRASKAAKIVHENDLTIDGMSKVSKAGARQMVWVLETLERFNQSNQFKNSFRRQPVSPKKADFTPQNMKQDDSPTVADPSPPDNLDTVPQKSEPRIMSKEPTKESQDPTIEEAQEFEAVLLRKIRRDDLVKMATTEKEFSQVEKRVAQALVAIMWNTADETMTAED